MDWDGRAIPLGSRKGKREWATNAWFFEIGSFTDWNEAVLEQSERVKNDTGSKTEQTGNLESMTLFFETN